MAKKNTAGRVAPKVSSSASLSPAASTHKTNASSVLRSAFSPSRFQLSLFASVIQALDSHQLRIHDTVSGRLRCEYAAAGTKITCLAWGYYGSDPKALLEERPSKKKKRRREDSNGGVRTRADVVVGLGTDQSEIHLFSPAEARVLTTLKGGHADGISDFQFKDFGLESEAWSIGNDKKLVQWNLQDGTISRSIPLDVSPALPLSALLPLNVSVLVASNASYQVDLHGPGNVTEVGEEISNIYTLIVDRAPSHYEDPESFLAASAGERYLNLRTLKTGALIGSLVAGGDVQSIAVNEHDVQEDTAAVKAKTVLAAVTKNGEVELFVHPFTFNIEAKEGASLKSIVKQKTRQHSAKIRITTPDQKSTLLSLVAATFQQTELVIAYQEGSGHLGFERLPWLDGKHDGLAISGSVVLTKAKTSLGIDKQTMNGVKDMGRTHVDESRTVISHGNENGDATDAVAVDQQEIIDISSAEEEESDSEDEGESPVQLASGQLVNGNKQGDAEMEDASDANSNEEAAVQETQGEAEEEDQDESDGEPTFGELLRAQNTETIDVTSSFPTEKQRSAVPYGVGSVKFSSGLSFGTVLSQALRTNDTNLLETCFHEQDLNVIRATIERLDSTLAAALLQKLAEKLHHRPGRAGSLMVWIQWTLVAHGGYLGSQPDIVKKLTALHRVVKERANSLQPLLTLKGKLDMLEAQMNLRRSMRSQLTTKKEVDPDEPAEGVIYVEGQEDSSSSGEEEEISDALPQRKGAAHGNHGALTAEEEGDSDDDDDDEMPDVVGVTRGLGDLDDDNDDEEDDDDSDDREGLIDDEASETDDDEGDDDEEAVDYDDVDSIGDESDSDSDDEDGPLTNGIS